MSTDAFSPPLAATKYSGQSSYFGGEAPLDESMGYLVVLGFGVFFSLLTTALVYLNKYFGANGHLQTSEHFKYVKEELILAR